MSMSIRLDLRLNAKVIVILVHVLALVLLTV